MPYGTIAQGQMFVQYMIPAEKRYPYPVVMVHGGGAQGTHMMGLGRRPGWVHYFVQAGYSVYWVDRPSYGRSPYHPDALGPSHLPNVPPLEALVDATNVFKTAQWPGPGGMNDPFIDQFMACESGNTSDEAFHSDLVWAGGVELVDRIGPCILHGHAFGGFFGWGVADRRPQLVKGILCMEINGNPFERQLRWGLTASPMTYDPPVTDLKQFTLVDRTPPPDSPRPIASPYKLQAEPARKWKNLQQIPIGVADERVRRRRIAGRERRVPEAGRLPGRYAAAARLRDHRQRQPDADGEEQPRSLRRPSRLAGPEGGETGLAYRTTRGRSVQASGRSVERPAEAGRYVAPSPSVPGLLGGGVRDARSAQDVLDRVVAFVARVLVERLLVVHRQRHRETSTAASTSSDRPRSPTTRATSSTSA